MNYTIKDIAVKAGVSKSTVSRVIAGNGYTSPETREKVLKAVEELKYKPNGLARAMVSQRTHSIGVIILANNYPVISHPFYGKVLDGILMAAVQNHYSVYVTTEQEMSLRSTEDMIVKRVDGLILVSRLRDEMIDYIDAFKIPYVMVNGTTEKKHVINILNDDWQGGKLAAEHLYEKGHRQIGILVGPQEHRSHYLRFQGFMHRLGELGCEVSEESIHYAQQSNFEDGKIAFSSMWERSHNKPTAIFATNDMLALGAMREIARHGLKVPGDIAIMGFDNIDFSEISTPSLTTVHIEKKKMGQDAVEVLDRLIRGETIHPKRMEYEPRLILRDTTRIPR